MAASVTLTGNVNLGGNWILELKICHKKSTLSPAYLVPVPLYSEPYCGKIPDFTRA
ncbi:hypothetical protein [Nostoc sp.]|uniref:hypothetical protein n=1 Tax=Nostoc sp. TaxID=1180 RepID=UPI003FA5A27E